LKFEDFVFGIKGTAIRDMNPHWRPQFYEAGFDCIKYGFVGRFENLESDLRSVIQRIYGANAVNSLRLSENYSPATTSATSRLKEFYTNEILAVVNDVYGCDFKEFNYKKTDRVDDL
jgi:hypothetical protein